MGFFFLFILLPDLTLVALGMGSIKKVNMWLYINENRCEGGGIEGCGWPLLILVGHKFVPQKLIEALLSAAGARARQGGQRSTS